MARTRAEIQTLVELNTGRGDKDTLMDSLCDTALKLAVMRHPFKDATTIPDDFTITEDATSVDISGTTNIINIITARIVQASGSLNKRLWLKQRQWWDEHVINPEDNQKGWPEFALRVGTNIILDRPAESNLELRLRVSTVPTFTSDATESPIALLDIFIEQYVTAYVFHSIEQDKAFYFWKNEALGPNYDRGRIGGSLLAAINADTFEPAEQNEMGRPAAFNNGTAIRNLIPGHPLYGETVSWF